MHKTALAINVQVHTKQKKTAR